ncbi:MAG TPA: aminodeoxychorismate synthase component I [Fimbriiglobus sp.]|nr:aminodeoxychorismate synthase component I [Fimbriiglobus sp.]
MSASAPPSEPQTVTALVEELIPCPDPWDVARKLAHLPYLLFLDSADQHPERGRYSYVMADPYRFGSTWTADVDAHQLQEAEISLKNVRRQQLPGLPPFQGGLAGAFSYELGRVFDRVPSPRTNEFTTPDISIGWYDWVISFDHREGRAWVVSTGAFTPPTHWKRYQPARRLNTVKELLGAKSDPPPRVGKSTVTACAPFNQLPLPGFPGITSNFSRDGYLAAVRRAIEYTHAGDCFQVNLSQRLLAPLTEHPLELYGRLRKTNPAPFACYFDAGDFQIVSASPERFLKVSPSGEVVTKPIKGTRPRGNTPEEDAANVRDLIASPKDRAENVMIVDLLRNDLGRGCEYGSVTVPKVCEIESYRDVHHLVSEVRGKLRPGMTPFDLLRAAFPGGSVTGAPKVRAMEIIAELEPTARGPYCGSVGFVGFDGSMDTNILIRTFTAGRGWLQFPVGGGVVADSDPEREYEETLHKAAGLLRALEKN